MPIYEFRCKECSKVAEFQMKMSDPNPRTCPTCGQQGLSKIMSLPSFQLKGGGWYSDAYDGKSNKAASGPKSEGSDSNGSSGSEPAASTSPASPASGSAASAAPAAAVPSASKPS